MDSESLKQLLAVATINYNNAIAAFRVRAKDADLSQDERIDLLSDIGSTAIEVEDLQEEIMAAQFDEWKDSADASMLDDELDVNTNH